MNISFESKEHLKECPTFFQLLNGWKNIFNLRYEPVCFYTLVVFTPPFLCILLSVLKVLWTLPSDGATWFKIFHLFISCSHLKVPPTETFHLFQNHIRWMTTGSADAHGHKAFFFSFFFFYYYLGWCYLIMSILGPYFKSSVYFVWMQKTVKDFVLINILNNYNLLWWMNRLIIIPKSLSWRHHLYK